jgi:hypothetical protein
MIILSVLSLLNAYEMSDNFNVSVMNATYKIQGDNGVEGTAFLVGIPASPDSLMSDFILVTAKHVFEKIKGDSLTIFMRRKSNDLLIKYPHRIQIRNRAKNLYTSHPTEDVAIMIFPMPIKAHYELMFSNLLATDSITNSLDIKPGDELFVFGYPLGAEANEAGFPILRGSKIASYPIVPISHYKSFLLDMDVFAGNSGGPVTYTIPTNKFCNYVLGLVSAEKVVEYPNNKKKESVKLSVAKVIHSKYIIETIELMKNTMK